MKEILGGNLKKFFDTIDKDCKNADITYAGERYEVWSVSDELFEKMCNMIEENFVELAGEDGWWRQSDGCNLGRPYEKNTVNGHKLISWSKGYFYAEESRRSRKYESLSDYLCNVVGCSQPRNVCACAMTLAKYNGMTMGELFGKFEG